MNGRRGGGGGEGKGEEREKDEGEGKGEREGREKGRGKGREKKGGEEGKEDENQKLFKYSDNLERPSYFVPVIHGEKLIKMTSVTSSMRSCHV